MKYSNLLLILFFWFLSASFQVRYMPTIQSDCTMAIDNATYMNIQEKTMLKEINKARTQPGVYLRYAQQLLNVTKLDSARLSNMISESIRTKVVYEDYGEVITVDTIKNNYYKNRVIAINEIIEVLSIATPLEPLMPDEALYNAAKKHGATQSVNNYIDHFGADGTWPLDRIKAAAPWVKNGNENIVSGINNERETVLHLLVDSGVEKRGHRQNILNPQWRVFSCYNVTELNKGDYKWWIQEFAY